MEWNAWKVSSSMFSLISITLHQIMHRFILICLEWFNMNVKYPKFPFYISEFDETKNDMVSKMFQSTLILVWHCHSYIFTKRNTIAMTIVDLYRHDFYLIWEIFLHYFLYETIWFCWFSIGFRFQSENNIFMVSQRPQPK